MSKVEREFHRKVAVGCFNRGWDYLEKKDRSVKDNLEMLCVTHASRYHWGLIGTPRNLAIGEWQISRVYADLGQPHLALQFAKSSLVICERNALTDIVHIANEAMARAHAVAKDYKRAKTYLSKARQQLDSLKLDEEEREMYLDQLRQTELLIGKP